MKRLVLVLLAGVGLSCGSATVHTMTGAFATCAQADLGQITPSGLSLLADVALAIEGNAATLEVDLAALAKLATVDAVKCAIAAVEAVISPQPMNVGSNSDATVLAAKQSGLERARAWSKAQK